MIALALGGALIVALIIAINQTHRANLNAAALAVSYDRVQTLEHDVSNAEDGEDYWRGRAQRMEAAANELADREADVKAREEAVQKREDAVTAEEDLKAARQVGDGKYTVGVTIEPGTYSATVPAGSGCYWAIYVSGTNYADIIQNDFGSSGTMFVTISQGQDFESSGCGTWTRQ